MIRSKWDQRIRRADELAAEYPFAAELLRFVGHVFAAQKDLYAAIGGLPGAPAKLGDDAALPPLLLKFPGFLERIAAAAPEPMGQSARSLRQSAGAQWLEALMPVWRDPPAFHPGPGQTDQLLAYIFLQPYAEYLAESGKTLAPRETHGVCPFCSSLPVAGVLRQEGDGGKRSLICAFCATEWNIGRIVCPACSEGNVEKLAVYTAEQFPHVRVEACDTCRYYIKTVDLTKDGHAVAAVDELATIPLNFWALEHDYIKLRGNMLGL